MKLLEAVERATRKARTGRVLTSWDKVAELMKESKSPEYYRSQWRRLQGTHDPKHTVRSSSKESMKKGYTEPRSILIEELKKIRTIDELIFATKYSRMELLGTIEQLRLDGYEVAQVRFGNEIAYTLKTNINTTYYEFKHYHDINKTIKIGLVSDTHIGSNYWQKTFLKIAYEDFKKNGITSVYHFGDLSDGMYSNRAGNIYEIHSYGFDQQVDEIEKDYPREEGITTYFITGNHDATHMMNGGANIGNAIEKRRPDMKYLGHEYAKVWLTDKVDLDLVHPRDGTSYALSYKIQKRIDAMSGGLKPKIMAVGHYHKNFYMFYRNIHAYSMASFQAQSPFMRGLGLVSDVGYLILEMDINKHGDIISISSSYKPLYETIKEEY